MVVRSLMAATPEWLLVICGACLAIPLEEGRQVAPALRFRDYS